MKKTTKRSQPTPSNRHFETLAWGAGRLVCGVDEAGRGPLAGPVVAAAAILHPNAHHPLLRDSKTLTTAELLEGYAWIVKNSWFGLGMSDHRRIDHINILQATKGAMYRALGQVKAMQRGQPPLFLVIDAVPLACPWADQVEHFPFGESRSISIAAASIIAKVTRDRLMERQHALFPAYQFHAHKGYGTGKHTQLLRTQGPSLIHRTSFITKPSCSSTKECSHDDRPAPAQQQSFC